MGGLGNQMFQYSTGRRLAERRGSELLLYLSKHYRKGTFRPFSLNRWAITARLASDKEAGGLARPSLTRRRLMRIFPWFVPPPDPRVVREESQGFNPSVLALSGDARLSGFWQNEKYFADIAPILRREFTLREPLDERSAATLNRIAAGPSAFLHVRRGDYVANNGNDLGKAFATCSPRYYAEAVERVRAMAGPKVRFFVFSDDPDWTRAEGIGGDQAEVVDWNAGRPERETPYAPLLDSHNY